MSSAICFQFGPVENFVVWEWVKNTQIECCNNLALHDVAFSPFFFN